MHAIDLLLSGLAGCEFFFKLMGTVVRSRPARNTFCQQRHHAQCQHDLRASGRRRPERGRLDRRLRGFRWSFYCGCDVRPPTGGSFVPDLEGASVDVVADLNGSRPFADGDTYVLGAGFGCHAPSDQDTGLASDFELLDTALANGEGKGGIGLRAIQGSDPFMVDEDLEKSRPFGSRAARLIVQCVKQMFAIVVELWCFHGAVPLDLHQREPTGLPFSADVYGD